MASGGTDWAQLARPWLRDLDPYDPGSSRDELRQIHHLDELAPLNWNEDLFGTPQHILDAAAAEVTRAALYPGAGLRGLPPGRGGVARGP